VAHYRCQVNLEDSPQEFIMKAPSVEWLEDNGYNVCGGPYGDRLEAEFWLYGGPPCSVQLLDDLGEKEIKWLMKCSEGEEKDYLESLLLIDKEK
jgi:hypothetical protein